MAIGEKVRMRRNLQEQLDALKDYADLYDAGKYYHAKGMAVSVKTITDILRSKAAFEMSHGNGPLMRSYWRPPSPESSKNGYHPLSSLHMQALLPKNGTSEFTAATLPAYLVVDSTFVTRSVSLPSWLKEKIIKPVGGSFISRGQMISDMRNKDGGAHPVSQPSILYEKASNSQGIGLFPKVFIDTGAGMESFVLDYEPPVHISSMRHMTHEVLTSPFVADYQLI